MNNIHSNVKVLDEHTASHVSELFGAFSDTSRVRLISILADHEMNVGGLAELVGISKSAVSHQLRGLRQMKLVQSRREGKEIWYQVVDEHIITLFWQGVNHIRQG